MDSQTNAIEKFMVSNPHYSKLMVAKRNAKY
jgi:hypothetical protein